MRHFLHLVLLATIPLAHAQTGTPQVRPGTWEVRSGSPGEPEVTYRLCFKTGDLEDLKLLLPRVQSADCAAGVLTAGKDMLHWAFECDAAQLTVSADYSLQPEAIEGKTKIRSGTPPTVRQRVSLITARRLGACEAQAKP
jgi:hypothetical protein